MLFFSKDNAPVDGPFVCFMATYQNERSQILFNNYFRYPNCYVEVAVLSNSQGEPLAVLFNNFLILLLSVCSSSSLC